MHALQRRLQRARRGRLPGMARDKRLAKEAREARERRETERVSVVGRAVWRADMPVFRVCKDPPPWEAELTTSRPVHARLAKRVAEMAARRETERVSVGVCRCHSVGITQSWPLTNCRKNSRRQWLKAMRWPPAWPGWT